MDKNYIIESLKNQINQLQSDFKMQKIGKVLEVNDGIARISGLSSCMSSEMLEFEKGQIGVALNLEEDSIGAVVLGDYLEIKEGDTVKTTGKILQVPVGSGLIGRVIDPLGQPLDGKGKIESDEYFPIEKIAPGVITRSAVNQPVQTGIKAIDSIIPIGRGQRELIIGDRQTGKTALAIDTIINQSGQNMKCIYVAIGQKESKIAKIISKFEETGAMEYTTIVVAGASDAASLLFLSPYAGCAIAEYFMSKGEDVLVVYDDLSKHAVAYREISLLLKRPPGREAYPGDIFYLHSRLLERAAKLNNEYGGGSLTALPIIETQLGDVSAYIPTNVISITDGQIYLESSLFYQGVRPAVNTGLSVSRVGSAAQIKAMKKVAGKLKLDLAQYRELAAFAQFGSDLDESTRKQLERGKRAVEILKQEQYLPLEVSKQVVIFHALGNGLLDNVPVERIKEFEIGLYNYLDSISSGTLEEIEKSKELSEEMEKSIVKIIDDYKNSVDYLIN